MMESDGRFACLRTTDEPDLAASPAKVKAARPAIIKDPAWQFEAQPGPITIETVTTGR